MGVGPGRVARAPRRLAHRLVAAAVCVALMAVATVARADFESGWQAFHRGDFAQAITAWQPLAAAGEARAQYNLGVLYDEGRGVAVDRGRAEAWWRRAAGLGHRAAQHNLALLYLSGDSGHDDRPQATVWLEAAAAGGFAPSQYVLGGMYADGRGVPRDDSRAHRLLLAAAEFGVAEAQYRLAELLAAGRGTAADPARSIAWLREAAGQGLAKAQHSLAARYVADGGAAGVVAVEALTWAALAARQGHAPALALHQALRVDATAAQIAAAEGLAEEFVAVPAAGRQ